MARPAKSVVTMSKNLTKEEKAIRLKAEKNLKGDSDKIVPPKYLNKEQKNIFGNIVDELKESGILGNLDIYILSTCSIALDRLQTIETLINENVSMMMDKDLLAAKANYTRDFFRCCNELSLSPQSRAKIGTIAVAAKEEAKDPILKVLGKR